MPITISKDLGFDAGHRLLNHEGKCRNLHGHRYTARITCSAPALDDVGRVIDFSVIKSEVGGWIDARLDHGYIGQDNDPFIELARECKLKWFVMSQPATAENLAALLLAKAGAILQPFGITVNEVTLWETPTSFATATIAGPGVSVP